MSAISLEAVSILGVPVSTSSWLGALLAGRGGSFSAR